MKTLNKGFMGIIVLIIIAILLLSYLNFDLKKIFSSEAVKNNFAFAWEMITYAWDNFLSKPWSFIWENAFKPVFNMMWNGFLAGLEGIKNSPK
jgi:hypothetical protein